MLLKIKSTTIYQSPNINIEGPVVTFICTIGKNIFKVNSFHDKVQNTIVSSISILTKDNFYDDLMIFHVQKHVQYMYNILIYNEYTIDTEE